MMRLSRENEDGSVDATDLSDTRPLARRKDRVVAAGLTPDEEWAATES